MNVFLKRLETPQIQAIYDGLDDTWNRRAAELNARFLAAHLPVQVANLSSIWTVTFSKPACYNWLLQHYMRLEGLALSWVGTGRIIFSLNYSQAEFDEVSNRFVRAAQNMLADGWWDSAPGLTNKAIKRRILGEMVREKF